MRKILFAALLACIVTSCTVNNDAPSEVQDTRSKQMVLFEDGNYAMFIHFGLYSKLEGNWKGQPYWG